MNLRYLLGGIFQKIFQYYEDLKIFGLLSGIISYIICNVHKIIIENVAYFCLI